MTEYNFTEADVGHMHTFNQCSKCQNFVVETAMQQAMQGVPFCECDKPEFSTGECYYEVVSVEVK